MRMLLGLLGGLCSASLGAAVVSYQGVARAPETGTLLYEEHHFVRQVDGRPGERLVLYRCPDGAPFARKTVSYGEPPYAPQFDLRDARFDYREGFARGALSGEAFVQRGDSGPLETEAVALGESLVVDAGFDEFVRSQWERLEAGDSVALRFLLPSRGAAYGFKLRKQAETQLYGETASVYRLALSGVFGWFVDAIDISYSQRDRRLLRFEGLSNIRAEGDRNLLARIDFPPERQLGAVAAEQMQRAAEEPLQACRLGG